MKFGIAENDAAETPMNANEKLQREDCTGRANEKTFRSLLRSGEIHEVECDGRRSRSETSWCGMRRDEKVLQLWVKSRDRGP
ncbi:hypothetical protein V2J09_008122 [Rumex salicifolius]